MSGQTETPQAGPPGTAVSSRERILQAAKNLFASKGYENTTTVAIARKAGSSESQLIKHFGSKEGLLEAIFDEAWRGINNNLRLMIRELSTPSEKFGAIGSIVLSGLEQDPEAKLLMLLEGRRVRREGHAVALSRGYVEFVELMDTVISAMQTAGKLRSDLDPQAIRSALIGMIEGMLRDQLISNRIGFPAQYGSKEVRQVLGAAVSSFLLGTNRVGEKSASQGSKPTRARSPDAKRFSESSARTSPRA